MSLQRDFGCVLSSVAPRLLGAYDCKLHASGHGYLSRQPFFKADMGLLGCTSQCADSSMMEGKERGKGLMGSPLGW